QCARIVAGDDLDLAGLAQRITEVAHDAVDAVGDRLLGQRFRDRGGRPATGHRGVICADGAIRKCQGNGIQHVVLLSSPANERGWSTACRSECATLWATCMGVKPDASGGGRVLEAASRQVKSADWPGRQEM